MKTDMYIMESSDSTQPFFSHTHIRCQTCGIKNDISSYEQFTGFNLESITTCKFCLNCLHYTFRVIHYAGSLPIYLIESRPMLTQEPEPKKLENGEYYY